MKLKSVQILALFCLSMSLGCASMFNESDQLIHITSNVSDVEVYNVSGKLLGKTPLDIHLKRSLATRLVLKKDGYEVFKADLPTKISGTFWLNVPLAFSLVGSTGATTDFAKGTMFEYSQDHFLIEMTPNPKAWNDQELNQFERQKMAFRFQVMNQSQIANDQARGGGQWLNTEASLRK